MRQTLTNYIHFFDKALERHWLNNRSFKEINHVILQIKFFYKTLDYLEQEDLMTPEYRDLVLTGCRLAADLSYKLQQWGYRKLNHSEKRLEEIKQTLNPVLLEKRLSQKILQETQSLLVQTQETGNEMGLGIVI